METTLTRASLSIVFAWHWGIYGSIDGYAINVEIRLTKLHVVFSIRETLLDLIIMQQHSLEFDMISVQLCTIKFRLKNQCLPLVYKFIPTNNLEE